MSTSAIRTPSVTHGVVVGIFIGPTAAGAMIPLAAVEALAGRGLAGDRYCEKRGSGSGWDECQVTLIGGEDLDAAAAEFGVPVGAGEHRRNLVVRGIPLGALIDRRFRVGSAVFDYDRPRPPCRWIAQLTHPRMTEALDGRGGLCARVIESGMIRPGDRVDLL